MKKSVLIIFVIFISLVFSLSAFCVDVETYRNNQLGFEISYPNSWLRTKPHDDSIIMLKNDTSVISVHVANWKGEGDFDIQDMGKYKESFQTGLSKRFPGSTVLYDTKTYLGSFPAYLISSTYTVKNIDVSVDVVLIQIISFHDKKIYFVNFESFANMFDTNYDQFQSVIATFNFR